MNNCIQISVASETSYNLRHSLNLILPISFSLFKNSELLKLKVKDMLKSFGERIMNKNMHTNIYADDHED